MPTSDFTRTRDAFAALDVTQKILPTTVGTVGTTVGTSRGLRALQNFQKLTGPNSPVVRAQRSFAPVTEVANGLAATNRAATFSTRMPRPLPGLGVRDAAALQLVGQRRALRDLQRGMLPPRGWPSPPTATLARSAAQALVRDPNWALSASLKQMSAAMRAQHRMLALSLKPAFASHQVRTAEIARAQLAAAQWSSAADLRRIGKLLGYAPFAGLAGGRHSLARAGFLPDHRALAALTGTAQEWASMQRLQWPHLDPLAPALRNLARVQGLYPTIQASPWLREYMAAQNPLQAQAMQRAAEVVGIVREASAEEIVTPAEAVESLLEQALVRFAAWMVLAAEGAAVATWWLHAPPRLYLRATPKQRAKLLAKGAVAVGSTKFLWDALDTGDAFAITAHLLVTLAAWHELAFALHELEGPDS